jgi:hypothetical protein
MLSSFVLEGKMANWNYVMQPLDSALWLWNNHIRCPLESWPLAMPLSCSEAIWMEQFVLMTCTDIIHSRHWWRQLQCSFCHLYWIQVAKLLCRNDGHISYLHVDFQMAKLLDVLAYWATQNKVPVCNLTFQKTGVMLASDSRDGTMKLWDLYKVSSRITWDTPSHFAKNFIIYDYTNKHMVIKPSFPYTSEWSKLSRACQLQHTNTSTMVLPMMISRNFQLSFHNQSTLSCQVFTA